MINKKQKGITLVALIITIIVMMILVAVSVAIIINSDLLGTAKRAGELYGQSANSESSLGEITIDGITYASIEDYLAGNPKISNGQYEAKNGVYVNRPDLTGFSREHTYFVTYDENGENETIGGKITTEEPKDWYDYNGNTEENKNIWANIMTKSDDGKVAYWVWIPRYCYKITYYTSSAMTTESDEITQYGTVDIKFLSRDNVHKYIENDVEKQKTFEQLKAEDASWTIPETFTWTGADGKEVALAGYWLSKYEINPATFNIAKLENGDIKVTNIDGNNKGTYEYYLDGVLQEETTGLYTYTNLEFGKTYELTIKQNGAIIGSRKVTATINTPSEPKTAPDLTGFKDAIAYYVTYDEDGGTETIGNRITFGQDGKPNNIPPNWYNYKNKIWANIVTASEELSATEKADIKTAETKNVAYWVWIPRYEYKTIDTSTESDYIEGDTILKETTLINFIDTKAVTPTIDGYQIPDSFVWEKADGTKLQLPGYWLSKYEISAAYEPPAPETPEETGT